MALCLQAWGGQLNGNASASYLGCCLEALKAYSCISSNTHMLVAIARTGARLHSGHGSWCQTTLRRIAGTGARLHTEHGCSCQTVIWPFAGSGARLHSGHGSWGQDYIMDMCRVRCQTTFCTWQLVPDYTLDICRDRSQTTLWTFAGTGARLSCDVLMPYYTCMMCDVRTRHLNMAVGSRLHYGHVQGQVPNYILDMAVGAIQHGVAPESLVTLLNGNVSDSGVDVTPFKDLGGLLSRLGPEDRSFGGALTEAIKVLWAVRGGTDVALLDTKCMFT